MQEVEDTVEQLNEGPTQGTVSSTVTPKLLKKLQNEVDSLTKLVHSTAGAAHKQSATQLDDISSEGNKALQKAQLSVETHRKRLKNVEELEGGAKCTRLILALQQQIMALSSTQARPVQAAKPQQAPTTAPPTTQLPPDSEVEPAEAILQR